MFGEYKYTTKGQKRVQGMGSCMCVGGGTGEMVGAGDRVEGRRGLG
jgi:hypothetical protein